LGTRRRLSSPSSLVSSRLDLDSSFFSSLSRLDAQAPDRQRTLDPPPPVCPLRAPQSVA
jgi:hypothetical protein